jgi:hypothetical protein
LKSAQSVFTLDPVRAKVKNHLNATQVAKSGVELRLVVVSLDSGRVRYVTQDGHVLETDNTRVQTPLSACAAELAAYQQALSDYAATGAALQQAVSHGSHLDRMEAQADRKRSGAKVARAEDALNTCIANSAGKTTDLVVGLEDGVIASSSIPCVFPPVKLGNESYVDGGIRWQLPLKAALDFPADIVVAVSTGALGVPPPQKSYATANLLDIAERAVFDILLWEAEERHLELVKLQAIQSAKRVWVIAPRIDVHDGFSVDPGLIDISIGYGYMCAADVLSAFPFALHTLPAGTPPHATVAIPGVSPAGPPTPPSAGTWVDSASNQQLATLADAIAACRRRCWEVEHTAFGMDAAPTLLTPQSSITLIPDPGALDEVRLLKTLIGLLLDARRLQNGRLPPDAVLWPDSWERHQWAPNSVPGVGDSPWKAFNSRAGTRTAGTRQNALVVKLSTRSEIFLLDPTKHLVSPASLPSLGGMAAVQVIPDEVSQVLDAIPTGSPI